MGSSYVRKNNSKPSENRLRSELQPPHTAGSMPHLAIGALVASRSSCSKEGKISIHRTTLHESSQVLSTFGVFCHILDEQLYVPLWAMTSCRLPDSKCSLHLFCIKMYFRIGWDELFFTDYCSWLIDCVLNQFSMTWLDPCFQSLCVRILFWPHFWRHISWCNILL